MRDGHIRSRWNLSLPLTLTRSPFVQAGRGRSRARPHGALGRVALAGKKLPHGASAQALLQPVDQPRQLPRRGLIFVKTEGGLALGQALGIEHVHGRGLEAEVRLKLAAETMKAQIDELSHM